MSEAREPETEAGRALSKRVSDLADSADVYLDSESDRVYMDVTDEGIRKTEREAAEKALHSAAERVRALWRDYDETDETGEVWYGPGLDDALAAILQAASE